MSRRFGVPPRLIADLFWQGKLNGEVCPVVRGRRQIPDDSVPVIKRVLIEAGALGPDWKPQRMGTQES